VIATAPAPILMASVRESRMVLERMLQHAGVPDGLLFSVRDCALYSAALGLSGYRGLDRQIERLRKARPDRLELVSEYPTMIVDCNGEHAWIVADTLLELAVEALRLTGKGRVIARGVAEPSEAAVIRALAEKYDLEASVTAVPSGDVEITVIARVSRTQTVLDRIRREGIEVPAALWWQLFHLSSQALAPDSFESRRHAGTVRVEADGRVVGRGDEDETDLAMLAEDVSRLGKGGRATPTA
jgi:hypothetical protein